MDYILFLTADVTVTRNLNEIRDHKYVDKAELQAMFEDPCECTLFISVLRACARSHACCFCSQHVHAVVQAHRP